MAKRKSRSQPTGRGRGRPTGADSAGTRRRIVHAAREVMNERGYRPATFQAIAQRAGLSRATVHYHFSSREALYEAVFEDVVATVITRGMGLAWREGTLLEQLAAFVAAAVQADFADRSIVAFLTSSHLEAARHPTLRSDVVVAMRGFLTSLLNDAIDRGELARDTDVTVLAEMLFMILWGVGIVSEFVDTRESMRLIAKQLNALFAHGLVRYPARSLRVDPGATAASVMDTFAGTWPGLKLKVTNVPGEQPIGAAEGRKPVVIGGDLTRAGVRRLFHDAYAIEVLIDGLGDYDTLDGAARPD